MTNFPARALRRPVLAMATIAALAPSARAVAGDLVPQTILRVSVVQWIPTQGQYQKWDALGGDFAVGDDGTIQLPVVGALAVGHMQPAALAGAIAQRIKDKIGLVSPPNTTVQVVSYPPIYIVGDVTTPGEYKFRDGLTVLQALALGGGVYRAARGATESGDVVSLASDIRGTDAGILRALARIARLQAEYSGSATIAFPPLPDVNSQKQRASAIFEQERILFTARANELDRQTKSLQDLKLLLVTEIDTLQQKIKMSDAAIQSIEKELAGVKTLVQKGIAVASRQSDLEQQLSRYQSDRLDNLTAVMRARQSISEATRNLQGLQDKRRTDIAGELQEQQANLDALNLRRETDQKLLLQKIAAEPSATADPSADAPLAFTLVRHQNGKAESLEAQADTELIPGDVLTVSNPNRASEPGGGMGAPPSAPVAAAPAAGPAGGPAMPEISSAAGRGT